MPSTATLSRNPVMWAGAVSGLLTAAVSVGLLTEQRAGEVNGWVTFAVTGLGLALPVAGAVVARRHVTPLARPRNSDGVELVVAPTAESQ